MKKPRPGLVDAALQSLNEEEAAKWQNLVRFNASYPQLISFLKECRAKNCDRLNPEHLSNWWANNRPRGKEALAMVAYSEQFLGQAPHTLLEMSVGLTAKMIQTLADRLDIESATNASKLYSLIELLKELRISSADLLRLSNSTSADALKYDGATKLADFLRATYKGTSFTESLNSAIEEYFTTQYNSE